VYIRELTTGQDTWVQTGHTGMIMAELPDGRVVSGFVRSVFAGVGSKHGSVLPYCSGVGHGEGLDSVARWACGEHPYLWHPSRVEIKIG
jgi:hypothetical protein